MATQPAGALFYIIGPSGAGKDSLIHAVCALALPRDRLRIALRYITRPPSSIGQHIEISPGHFEEQRQAGAFLMDWSAHGFQYAIGTEVVEQIEAGDRVMIDGSRAYLSQARQRYPRLKVITIDADPSCLPERLQQRGRETAPAIAERLQRNQRFQSSLDAADWRIENNQDLVVAAAQMLAIIRSV